MFDEFCFIVYYLENKILKSVVKCKTFNILNINIYLLLNIILVYNFYWLLLISIFHIDITI